MSKSTRHISLRTVLLTVVAMLAFAANSILCRLALGQELVDAATFATVRVISGAATLSIILRLRRRTNDGNTADWRAAVVLSTYMVSFSFAFLSLSVGTGTLILFGAVQLTMIIFALRQGEHFPLLSWTGLFLAALGLVYLVSPGVTAPDPLSAILMTIAGIAWGLYSSMGRSAADPLEATARNFVYSVPPLLIVSLFYLRDFSISPNGLALAVASGAIASGCGYAIWYAALRNLTAVRAATVQLSVPAIAAFAGVLLLSEHITLRLMLSAAATLGGVAIVLTQSAAKASR